MPRFTLDDALAVLTSADNDLDDGHDIPHWISVRPGGGARHEIVAEIVLTPVDDRNAGETFEVTIRRSGTE